jgi:outer membrane protein assembly factor BamE (lipoprotein component of BamABCDE complex)
MFRPLLRASICFVICFTILAIAGVLVASAQTTKRVSAVSHSPGEDPSPPFLEYRGVQLGMTADEVRKKLGDPKEKGDEQDFYIFSESETAQFLYDKTHKVTAISADFMTVGTNVPTAKAVFGAEIEAKADGSVYKMVRYPKAGYWLSYNRTSGTSPLTTVTLQRIQ